MASVHRRSRTRADGTRYTRYVVHWRDERDRQRTRTFKTKKAATMWANRVELVEASGGVLEEPEEAAAPTVGEWVESWYDIVRTRVAAGQLAPTTAAGYESRMRVHILPALGDVRLPDLTPGDVEDLTTRMQADGQSAGSAASVRRTLSKFLADAKKRGLVERNVARDADAPTLRRKPPSTFTPDEMAAIVEGCRTARLGPMFLFVAVTGMRASEARGLEWQDVDLEEGWYRVERGSHRIGPKAGRVVPAPGLVESHPKTAGSGERTPMSRVAVELLAAHQRAQRRERMAAKVWLSDKVFTTREGAPLEAANVLRAWKRLLSSVGVAYRPDPSRRGRGLHELRRTFATRLREAGVPLEDVQALGRWASPAVLLASYAGVSDARLREAAEAAGRALEGGA